jgi:hypothetical protein
MTPENEIPLRRLTAEQFEALLLEVRNSASLTLGDLALGEIKDDETNQAVIEDTRKVWHAAEVALGILLFGKYVPKLEALSDVRAMLAWLDDEAPPTPHHPVNH